MHKHFAFLAATLAVLYADKSFAISLCGPIPENLTCGRWVCTNFDGEYWWEPQPSSAGVSCTSDDGNPGTCDGNYTCVPTYTTTPGTIHPNYLITHVYYSPPGSSSTITYNQGNTFGSTVSLTNSFQQSVQGSVSASGTIGIATVSGTVSVGSYWGTTASSERDVAFSVSASETIPGVTDDINHDYDEIWLLLNPKLNVTIKKVASTGVIASNEWSFAANQDPLTEAKPYVVYVGWLKNPASMPQNVKNVLNDNGITESYYPELLKANPFSNGSSPNQFMDPVRFEFIRTVPFTPRSNCSSPGSALSYTVSQVLTNSSSTELTQNFTTGVTIGAEVGFSAVFKASLNVSNELTWSESTNSKLSYGSSTSQTLTVGQPSCTYSGPTFLRVYEDKLWKTQVFTLDYF
ncbi:MAG: hypothetical protein L0Y64_04115 [Myxococcaceae bacterium]|nr:hypothetical protein [Myxococcaceae bacterium]